MTYRTDSATSPPQGRKAASAPEAAPTAPSPQAPAVPSGDINHNMHVYHYMDLQQSANIPLPGTYRPAHPAQNGKG